MLKTAAGVPAGIEAWVVLTDDGISVAGNMLTGPTVIEATLDTFKRRKDLPFADRLMASLDAGLKYNGYALEAEYYWRELSNFVGSGTDVIADIKDDGYQIQASAMVLPRLVQLYTGVSEVRGDFGNASEWRLGVNYFPKEMRGLRVNGEWISVNDGPVGYTAYPLPVGADGDVVHVNFELNF